MIKIKTNLGFELSMPDEAAGAAADMLKLALVRERELMTLRHEEAMAAMETEHARLMDNLRSRGWGEAGEGGG